MVSRGRLLGLLVLVILVAWYAAYSSPGSLSHAWLSGLCFRERAPSICYPAAWSDEARND
jgi:hypothetical protein